MLRLLSDECFEGKVVRGLRRRRPSLDLVRVQDVGLRGMNDPGVLAWAATENRILLTHDRQTVPGFAYARVLGGEPMPGVFVINDKTPVRGYRRRPVGRRCQRVRRVAGPGRVPAILKFCLPLSKLSSNRMQRSRKFLGQTPAHFRRPGSHPGKDALELACLCDRHGVLLDSGITGSPQCPWGGDDDSAVGLPL